MLQKYYQEGNRISVQFRSEIIRDELNEFLWMFKEDSFLPHGVDVGDEGVFSCLQPVLLTVNSSNVNASTVRFFVDKAHFDIEYLDLYQKLVFVMCSDDDESIKWGRLNWVNLKKRGYKLDFYDY
ncbi:DNA polymerase III subunit chi [Candidatus Liberibacter brunswickensis]|uniref:DNA polymerase III subunit chi n=1 Tax=Candidatus Liberibacter brunswickensis TaxID=1968796 RepID=UPI002FE124D8